MKTQTPAPWRALASAAPGYPIAIGYGGTEGEFEHSTIALVKERRDAAVIVAAPNLLTLVQAREAALAAYERIGTSVMTPGEIEELAGLRAVLSKIERARIEGP